ncbi:2-C-methyl-D-erythritol 4-phosphate cytidylyltransferase [Reichenbachiella faecimaris]|uniref:2-C-methyl-D-erythritol 4-phosphate cytidylyltransferase n=1 Tax=Reichenbachiella faecimaris TaxID=692418 RepID=A0A1W2G8F2_REIFA|nr:2-C-methyl-D-erythritol 4-phosphate cytidylyltransferase [Reichenbachiella faecimaris]SMD32947.1 2-C-methyl-D-erythritol 4-phosphate cytidylyltransferase [Reichenbachiella faecimaris]
MKNYAVIVAGGSGSRMQTAQPKQFLELEGRPVLMHTLDAFANCDLEMHIILVLPEDHIATWQDLVKQHTYKTRHQVTTGGSTRFDSVKNGLGVIDESGIVAIHDGARPLISAEVIQRTVSQAQKTGSGIAAVQMKDSIRQLINGQNKAVDRSQFYTIQTPQTFKVNLIKTAFENSKSNAFTDDASVLEANGVQVNLVEGSYDNLKITTPEDLVIAASILKRRK